ncbi:MAG: adenosylcobinamide-phosphate synthase CbiB [Aestuariivirga sp.]
MDHFSMLALALVVETFVGYPPFLQNLIGHPVQWMGALISYLDEGFNDEGATDSERRMAGVLALVIIVLIPAVAAGLVAWVLSKIPGGYVLNVLFATTLLAQKSLRDHVTTVASTLPRSLPEARAEVAKIVGRDVANLDQSGVAKAALETLAENTADGIVAPAFWYALLGLPGIVAYKAINTADSMIGHKSEKYLAFGWASARTDDVVNWIPARWTGLLFAAAARLNSRSAAKAALKSMWRDAGKHRSPNAGWPEAAMAGALGLKFGGPRNYHGEVLELPVMGDGRDRLVAPDISAGLQLYEYSLVLLLAVAIILAMVL